LCGDEGCGRSDESGREIPARRVTYRRELARVHGTQIADRSGNK
jgi:hypothetical protein